MPWKQSKALSELRLSLNMNQKVFSEKLAVTPAHISLIEAGKAKPSKMLLKLASHEFGVNLNWLENGEGEPFQDPDKSHDFEKYKTKETMKRRVMLTAAFLVPLLPSVAVGLAIGASTEEILDKMKRAYGAKSMTDLATRFLKTDISTLSRWKSKNKIPDKYLQDLPGPLEYYVFDEELIYDGRGKITDFIKEIIKEDRKKHLDFDEIVARFSSQFPIQVEHC